VTLVKPQTFMNESGKSIKKIISNNNCELLDIVIVHDDNTQTVANEIYRELPDEMNKELMDDSDLGDFLNKNNYKVRFIFVSDTDSPPSTTPLIQLLKMPDEDVTAIKLVYTGSPNVIPPTGTIEFYQKDGSGWTSHPETSYYLKKESLFGAIFAADKEMYDCVMKKAFKNLNLVTKIYLNRSSTLESYYFNINNPCWQPHSSAKGELENIEILSREEISQFPANGINRMQAIADYNTNIKNENQRAQLFSCALIY